VCHLSVRQYFHNVLRYQRVCLTFMHGLLDPRCLRRLATRLGSAYNSVAPQVQPSDLQSSIRRRISSRWLLWISVLFGARCVLVEPRTTAFERGWLDILIELLDVWVLSVGEGAGVKHICGRALRLRLFGHLARVFSFFQLCQMVCSWLLYGTK